MSDINKSYRIRTNIETEATSNGVINIDANLIQDYDALDILSVSLRSADAYRLHNADYGVVVGRVLANNGFGVPNAKISIFIASDNSDGEKIKSLYPYSTSYSKNEDGVRYNLLPDEKVSDCHQVVGTFPNKRYALDNDTILEVFEKYYKYTTRTNNSGDYLICGVPTGSHTLHMDLDLSDCGILSQRPRDFVYKGYTIEQFENPNMFKDGTNYNTLSQIFTQNQIVNVQPFWGNSSLGETIGITRADIEISFTFEPTCVFMGSITSDNSSQGISQKCIPTEHMGGMDELVTGEGTIEMIRKTPGGSVEEFDIKGTQLINADGIWCYQIPMNLDYMMTDEYGNMVPTDNPEKGIPTRTRVRFRISMEDNEENTDNYFRPKVLVPHNPQNTEKYHEDYDYNFGTATEEESYRDLFWNNVYTVKSYIPRIQKHKLLAKEWKNKSFTGIKGCNFYGSNNPIPYNNIRIKLPLMFTLICLILKIFIKVVTVINCVIAMAGNMLADVGDTGVLGWHPFKKMFEKACTFTLNVLDQGMCPDLENWYFAPVTTNLSTVRHIGSKYYNILQQTLSGIMASDDDSDSMYNKDDQYSIDDQNDEQEDDSICLTIKTDYILSCLEMNLAMEYKVINFDFYNDWINGLIYIPRFMRFVSKKKTFLGITFAKAKVKGCMDDTKIFSKTRRLSQQCSLPYAAASAFDRYTYNSVTKPNLSNKKAWRKYNNLHKSRGYKARTIFGKNGGICHEYTTSKSQRVYYLKPCEWKQDGNNYLKATLFATDIVLLGSLNDCDLNGLPQSFKHLSSTSYIMPTNLALTNMETNGPLYAESNETVCAGSNSTKLDNETVSNSGVTVVDISNGGLKSELKYYKAGSSNTAYDTSYEGDELSDTIALTEAAGISWNWTGPGQGSVDKSNMYYPGGHFLGLSCTNSETNIKSCLNLTRICEVGSSMSQRKEEPYRLLNNGNLSYVYTVPTGFISNDEIVDTDFRTMFASMNHGRLLATKINPDTGYRYYDFSYLRPNSFNGEFQGFTGGPYNTSIQVTEENLTDFGVARGKNRDDYDPFEKVLTQTRTIENSNIDYYMFRFGLDYSDLKKTNKKHISKFYLTENSRKYLPQYENSYYFYFGMKDGATALDEFNKQFFSVCDKTLNKYFFPTLSLMGEDIDINNGTGTVLLTASNVEVPMQFVGYRLINDNIDDDSISAETIDNYISATDYTVVSSEIYSEKTSFSVSGIPFGNYEFKIIDANGDSATATIDIGADVFNYYKYVEEFMTIGGRSSISENANLIYGGYILISGLTPNKTYSASNITISSIIVSGQNETQTQSIGDFNIFYLKEPNKDYTVLVEFSSDVSKKGTYKLLTFRLKDGSYADLKIGTEDKYWSYSHSGKSIDYSNKEWWNNNDSFTGDSESAWVLRSSAYKYNACGDTWSNNIFVTDGAKVVWGNPQSSTERYTNIIGNTDDLSTVKTGTLDDEASYFATNINDGTISGVNYSIAAYRDEIVCGNIKYYVSGGNFTTVNSVKDKLYYGYGYTIKLLPYMHDGSFVEVDETPTFGMYIDEENLKNNIKDYASSMNIEEEDINAVVYPAFRFPVINKPFSADVEIMTIMNLTATGEVSNGELTGSVNLAENEAVIRVKLGDLNHYKDYYASGKFLTFVDEDGATISSSANTFKISENKEIVLHASGYGIDDYSYTIIGGMPNSGYTAITTTLSDEPTCSFYSDINYSLQGKTYSFSKTGSTNENIKYYLGDGSKNSLISEKTDGSYCEQAVCSKRIQNYFRIYAGSYIRNNSGLDTIGEYRVAYGYALGLFNTDATFIKFPYHNDDGSDADGQNFIQDYQPFGDGEAVMRLYRKRIINSAKTINDFVNNATEITDILKDSGNMIINNSMTLPYVIGVYSAQTINNGKLVIAKLYSWLNYRENTFGLGWSTDKNMSSIITTLELTASEIKANNKYTVYVAANKYSDSVTSWKIYESDNDDGILSSFSPSTGSCLDDESSIIGNAITLTFNKDKVGSTTLNLAYNASEDDSASDIVKSLVIDIIE